MLKTGNIPFDKVNGTIYANKMGVTLHKDENDVIILGYEVSNGTLVYKDILNLPNNIKFDDAILPITAIGGISSNLLHNKNFVDLLKLDTIELLKLDNQSLFSFNTNGTISVGNELALSNTDKFPEIVEMVNGDIIIDSSFLNMNDTLPFDRTTKTNADGDKIIKLDGWLSCVDNSSWDENGSFDIINNRDVLRELNINKLPSKLNKLDGEFFIKIELLNSTDPMELKSKLTAESDLRIGGIGDISVNDNDEYEIEISDRVSLFELSKLTQPYTIKLEDGDIISCNISDLALYLEKFKDIIPENVLQFGDSNNRSTISLLTFTGIGTKLICSSRFTIKNNYIPNTITTIDGNIECKGCNDLRGVKKISGDLTLGTLDTFDDDLVVDGDIEITMSHIMENRKIPKFNGKCTIIDEDGYTVGEYNINDKGEVIIDGELTELLKKSEYIPLNISELKNTNDDEDLSFNNDIEFIPFTIKNIDSNVKLNDNMYEDIIHFPFDKVNGDVYYKGNKLTKKPDGIYSNKTLSKDEWSNILSAENIINDADLARLVVNASVGKIEGVSDNMVRAISLDRVKESISVLSEDELLELYNINKNLYNRKDVGREILTRIPISDEIMSDIIMYYNSSGLFNLFNNKNLTETQRNAIYNRYVELNPDSNYSYASIVSNMPPVNISDELFDKIIISNDDDKIVDSSFILTDSQFDKLVELYPNVKLTSYIMSKSKISDYQINEMWNIDKDIILNNINKLPSNAIQIMIDGKLSGDPKFDDVISTDLCANENLTNEQIDIILSEDFIENNNIRYLLYYNGNKLTEENINTLLDKCGDFINVECSIDFYKNIDFNKLSEEGIKNVLYYYEYSDEKASLAVNPTITDDIFDMLYNNGLRYQEMLSTNKNLTDEQVKRLVKLNNADIMNNLIRSGYYEQLEIPVKLIDIKQEEKRELSNTSEMQSRETMSSWSANDAITLSNNTELRHNISTFFKDKFNKNILWEDEFDESRKDVKAYVDKLGQIHINRNKVTLDTPFHEIAHLILPSLKEEKPELYNNAISELKTLAIWKDIQAKYPDYTEEEQEYEALCTIIGNTSAILYKEQISKKKKNIISRLVDKIKNYLDNKLGIKDASTKNLRRLILETSTKLTDETRLEMRLDEGRKYLESAIYNMDFMDILELSQTKGGDEYAREVIIRNKDYFGSDLRYLYMNELINNLYLDGKVEFNGKTYIKTDDGRVYEESTLVSFESIYGDDKISISMKYHSKPANLNKLSNSDKYVNVEHYNIDANTASYMISNILNMSDYNRAWDIAAKCKNLSLEDINYLMTDKEWTRVLSTNINLSDEQVQFIIKKLESKSSLDAKEETILNDMKLRYLPISDDVIKDSNLHIIQRNKNLTTAQLNKIVDIHTNEYNGNIDVGKEITYASFVLTDSIVDDILDSNNKTDINTLLENPLLSTAQVRKIYNTIGSDYRLLYNNIDSELANEILKDILNKSPHNMREQIELFKKINYNITISDENFNIIIDDFMDDVTIPEHMKQSRCDYLLRSLESTLNDEQYKKLYTIAYENGGMSNTAMFNKPTSLKRDRKSVV